MKNGPIHIFFNFYFPKKLKKPGKYHIKDKYRPSSTNCYSELLVHCSQILNLALIHVLKYMNSLSSLPHSYQTLCETKDMVRVGCFHLSSVWVTKDMARAACFHYSLIISPFPIGGSDTDGVLYLLFLESCHGSTFPGEPVAPAIQTIRVR